MDTTSLKKSFHVLLLFYIACVYCDPDEEVTKCTDKLKNEFEIPQAAANLWHGLTELNENKFLEHPLSDEVKGYYLYLLDTVESQRLLTIMSAKWFCHLTTTLSSFLYGYKEYIEWCEDAFRKIGCVVSILEEITVKKIYPDWFTSIPESTRKNETVVSDVYYPLVFKIAKIREYITDHLFKAIERLPDDNIYDWKEYCEDRID